MPRKLTIWTTTSLLMSPSEEWKEVPSAPGLLVSSLGRVMVKPYTASMPNGGKREYGGVPTYGQWDGKRFLYARRGHKTCKVHRLVCEGFNGPCPPGLLCMHRDENSRNNVPTNLEWGTQKQNLNAPGFLTYCHARTGDNSPTAKARAKRK